MRTFAPSLALLFFVAGCPGPSTSETDAGGGGTDTGGPGTDGGDPGTDGGGGSDDAPTFADTPPVPGAPTCEITGPLDGTEQPYDEDFVFIATATDPEDGALGGADVEWTSDLVTAALGTGETITVALEPGEHTITCTATDSDGNTGTDTILVTSASPIAIINHPGDGETRAAGSDIPFVGVARDFEDGDLSGASLVWTSSIDGALGTGLSFNDTLSAGTNVVTLTVTDSDGNSATDTVTLTITP